MDRTPQPLGRQAGGVSVWHAENLDVDALLESYGQRVGEGVLWLGHCVYIGLADDARCRDTGRVPLRAEYLRNVIGRHHVDAVRKAALDAGYVDRDRSYRAGNRSQAYWILPPYDRARLVRRQIIDPGLRHNIQQVARRAPPGDVAANPAQRDVGGRRGLRTPMAEPPEGPDRRRRLTSAKPSIRRTRLPSSTFDNGNCGSRLTITGGFTPT